MRNAMGLTCPGLVANLGRYDSFFPEIGLRKKNKESGEIMSCLVG